MKKYIKYITNLSIAAFSVLILSSCSEDTMFNINQNTNNPTNANTKFIVPELQTSSAFSIVGGDLSLYSSIYTEQQAGIHNQMYNAEMRLGEPTLTTTYNNTWVSAYSNIKNAKLVIKKSSEGGSEYGAEITLGIGKVYLAYNGAILTDLFGDVPFSQAGIVDERGMPVYFEAKIDKQEDIYKDIFTLLDEAIVSFGKKDAGPFGAIGAYDFIYKGIGENWEKAAYGLKARYTMRLLHKSSNKTADLNNILDYISKSFTSAAEEFKYAKYDGVSQSNPLAGFFASREALAASKSLVDKLSQRKDPRLLQILVNKSDVQLTELSKSNLAPNGNVIEQTGVYDHLATDNAWSAPTQMLSYHELLFLKAEAYARLGKKAEAETALKEAITASFDNLAVSLTAAEFEPELDATVSSTYYTISVKPLFDANPLKEIMIQKYLAFVGAGGESIETFNDIRRMKAMGENFITLANPNNAETKFPLRFTYGNDEVSANSNFKGLVGDGTYVYKENVWWGGGSK